MYEPNFSIGPNDAWIEGLILLAMIVVPAGVLWWLSGFIAAGTFAAIAITAVLLAAAFAP